MKKLFKPFSVLFAAAALMTACSNDEPVPGTGAEDNGDGVTAYLQVNIQAAGDIMSKAGHEDGDLVNGDEKEHLINNAKFYFFDANGLFVQEASVWNGGNDNGDHGSVGNKIEYIGKNVLVLKGLKSNEYPNYMLTVLNVPAYFAPTHGMTLDQVRDALVDIYDPESRFVMSTSSYIDDSVTDKYGTNKLQTTNFKVQPAGTSTPDNVFDGADPKDVVQVYVERLAAKIDVTFASAANADGYYPIKVSVAGNPNDEGNDDEGLTQLYIKFSKWGINATAENSHMTKDIKDFAETGTGAPYANWNVPALYRSYWGKSVVYDQKNPTLNYIGYNQVTVDFGKADYCPENTNIVDNIFKTSEDGKTKSLIDKNVTSVIFAAEVFEKVGNEYKELDLVRFNGLLYRKADFLAYVLDNLNTRKEIEYYKLWAVTPIEGQTPVKDYKQVDADDLKLDFVLYDGDGKGTGIIKVVSNLTTEDTYVKKNEDGTYTEGVNFTAEEIATLNANLAKFYNGEASESIANAYNGGKMFYSVPVKHNKNLEETAEGFYGVVRNHWYEIKVNKVESLGHGVFVPGEGSTPGEPLIPEDPKDPTYYLGATINILSWKVVSQEVDL